MAAPTLMEQPMRRRFGFLFYDSVNGPSTNIAHVAPQLAGGFIIEPASQRLGVNPRLPKYLVRHPVADSRKSRLEEERAFDGKPRMP